MNSNGAVPINEWACNENIGRILESVNSKSLKHQQYSPYLHMPSPRNRINNSIEHIWNTKIFYN